MYLRNDEANSRDKSGRNGSTIGVCLSGDMKFSVLFLLLGACLVQAAEDDATWSKPEKGVRGRLLVLPSAKPDSPFCRVFIELQNVGDVAGQITIRFSPEKLDLQATENNGKPLAGANGPYDGMSPIWKPISLPYAGTIKFQISFPGLGYQPEKDKVIIDMGPGRSWIIPDKGAYFLSGTFSVTRESSDHPYMDWSGKLTLPMVQIPKAK